MERTKFADRLERDARYLMLALIPIALIAIVDLSTGSLLDDRRIDIALLAGTAMAVWGAHSHRRMAERLRSGGFAERPTRRQWVLQLASVAVLLGLCAGMGYLIGGWVPAVLLPAATIILTAGSAAVGIRRRRRIV
jgi:hypothetical protein